MSAVKKYFVIAKISLTNAINYRTSLISGFLAYALFMYVFMCLWRAIYKDGNVSGYSLPQIIWYLTMTELVGFGARIDLHKKLNEEVRSGGIAYLINRPTPFILYEFASAVGQMVFNLLSCGVMAVILGLVMAGPLPGFHLYALPFVLFSMAVSLVIQFFFLMLIGLSSFVMEDNFAVFLIYQKLVFMLGLFIPIEFLPEWLQKIAKSLPFSYISWAPAKLFVDFSFPLFAELAARQLLWAAIMVALCTLAYRGAAKRLQAQGG